MKRWIKYRNSLKYFLLKQFFWKGLFHVTNCQYTSYLFTVFITACNRIPNNLFHTRDVLSDFYIWINIYCCSTFDLKYIFFPSNIHLHLQDMCFVNVFNSFIFVIILKMLRSKSSVLFGTHTLLYRSLTVFQLLLHLSKLM